MKKRKKKFQNKILFFIINIIILSVVSTLTLIIPVNDFVYSNYIKSRLIEETNKLVQDYADGVPIEEFKESVNWLNSKININITVLNDPNQLKTKEDFENYMLLVSEEERKTLLKGNTVTKFVNDQGYKILIVLNPLCKGGTPEGVLYSYTIVKQSYNHLFTFFWFIGFAFFACFSVYLAIRIFKNIVKPIKEMEVAALKVSKGDFSTRINYNSSDEIGRLAKAFNDMSVTIHEVSERRREFIQNISHEFRTPLCYVHGYTSALIDGLIKTPEDQMKYLKLIEKETSQLKKLAHDLLDVVKLEAVHREIDKYPIALAQCVEETIEIFEETLENNDVQLSLNIDPDVIINGNEKRMKQVIQHIIDNAIRYSEKGDAIEILLLNYDTFCQLIINDNGVGMSEEDLHQVKDLFYRVNKARTRLDGGSGLGLSLVEHIVKSHNGEMIIESEPNIGTKVTIQLPTIH